MVYYIKVIYIREIKFFICNLIYCENKYDFLGVFLNIFYNYFMLIQVIFILGSMLLEVLYDNIIEYNIVCYEIFYCKNSFNCIIVFYGGWNWLVFK